MFFISKMLNPNSELKSMKSQSQRKEVLVDKLSERKNQKKEEF
jgi:hypothetical protein